MHFPQSLRVLFDVFFSVFSSPLLEPTITPEVFSATQFDVIIVGGGTAGLVVANRLSTPVLIGSTAALRVGVIEAGLYAPEGDPLIDIPYGANLLTNNVHASTVGNPKYDWMYETVPQAALDGRIIGYPR